MKKSIAFMAAIAMAAIAQTAEARDGVVTFNGLILPSCVLTIGTPGTLAVSSDGHSLSSQNPGGISGTATLLTTGGAYNLQVDPPSDFLVKPPQGTAETMSTQYTASGATLQVVNNVLTPLRLGLGLTTLDVNMTARKDTGVFPAGLYTANVVVRCVAA